MKHPVVPRSPQQAQRERAADSWWQPWGRQRSEPQQQQRYNNRRDNAPSFFGGGSGGSSSARPRDPPTHKPSADRGNEREKPVLWRKRRLREPGTGGNSRECAGICENGGLWEPRAASVAQT